MAGRRLLIVAAAAGAGVAGVAVPGVAAAAAPIAHCSAGARTLAAPGSRLYPETGNGGYASLHTLVHLVYDAKANRFLPGNSVVLTDRAAQCLTSFSLDFERHSRNTSAGPDLTVRSVTVDGQPARFRFAQPTYPGDPNGQDDTNPAAHEASQTSRVGGLDAAERLPRGQADLRLRRHRHRRPGRGRQRSPRLGQAPPGQP